MLYVILMIFKILGIIILSILGLVLLIVLVCLFVPVTYRVRGVKQGEAMQGVGKINWLFCSVSANIDNKDKKLKVKIRLFGISLEVFRKVGKVIGKVYEALVGFFKKIISIFKKLPKDNEASDNIKKEKIENGKPVREKTEKDKIERENIEKEYIKKENIKKDNTLIKDTTHETTTQSDDEEVKVLKTLPKLGFWQRCKMVAAKIWYFPQWLYIKMRKIYLTISRICGKIRQWKQFLAGETFKRALRFILSKGNDLRKHILPRKIVGNITYGFNDPALTGQTLAIVSAITPLYRGKFKVIPVFDQTILAGDILMRGHVLGFTLLRIAWSVYRNKDIKEIIHHLGQKEE